MNLEPIARLATEWRTEVLGLRRRGADATAEALESCAEELEERVRKWGLERLTLEEAASESGYSYSRLQHCVAGGQIPNAGVAGSPRIRRADLPRKAGRLGRPGGPDLAGEVLRRRLL